MRYTRQAVFAGLLVLGLSIGGAQAAVNTTNNNFTMLDPANGGVGGNNDTVFTWDETYNTAVGTAVTNATLSSVTAFFGFSWTTHDIKVYAPGTYTIDTVQAGMYTVTVPDGQVGVHMLFNWNTTSDIDVIDVWQMDAVFGPSAMVTTGGGDAGQVWDGMSKDWDADSINGGQMIDGPFGGFSANFNVMGIYAANPPVITVTNDTASLTVGDPAYGDTEALVGVTANDTEDGDITADIVVGGDPVDTNTIGTYVITYDVVDSTTLPAAQKTQTVSVHSATDTTAPVITVDPDPLTLALNATYDRTSGVTILDDFDGNLIANHPGQITWGGETVDTSVAGASYNITIHACDSAGTPNCSDATRTVNIQDLDITPPVITLTGDNPMSLEVGATFAEPGFTATDNIDGNIHSSVVVSGDTVNTAVAGKYVLLYNVQDAAGNLAPEKTRIVNVVAAECKVQGAVVNNFTMYDNSGAIVGGSNTVAFTWGGSLLTEADIDPTTHLETVPGNATMGTECLFFANPWFADPVWIFGPGTYTFDACPAGAIAAGEGGALTDGSSSCTPGDPANLVTITVGEGQLLAHMLFSWSAAKQIDMFNIWEQQAVYGGLMAQDCGGADANKVWDLASIDIDGDGIMGLPFVDGPFKSFSGNMEMMLVDSGLPQDVPVLEIQGDNPLSLALGDTFTCPSAMAEDMVDGPLCDKVTKVGCDQVNTAVPGAYSVTYQVVDSDGHNVSHDLLAIVFGPAADVPTGSLAGANPLVTFGLTADHPVVVMNSALDAFGHAKTLINGVTTINVEPCEGRDCISSAGFNVCTDPGATAFDLQDGALTGDNLTTTIEKYVAGSWVAASLDCSVPAQYRFTYTASDSGDVAPGMVAAQAVNSTTATRLFYVNDTPTADAQVPAEQSQDADVGGGCSVGHGQNSPMQRADLLLLGGFLAALGIRRVKRSDV